MRPRLSLDVLVTIRPSCTLRDASLVSILTEPFTISRQRSKIPRRGLSTAINAPHA
jgi:hypothetical protein